MLPAGDSSIGVVIKGENLRPGSYNVEVVSMTSGMRKHDTVTLDADRELDFDLRSTRIAGKVLEAGTDEPLSDVAVRAEPVEAAREEGPRFNGAVTTDDRGRFVVAASNEGSWRLSAAASVGERPVAAPMAGQSSARASRTVFWGPADEVILWRVPFTR